VVKKFGCRIIEREPLMVTLADGNKLFSKKFTEVVANNIYIRCLLNTIGYLVLGVEWLVTLGDITYNFDKLTMDFKVQGKDKS